MQRQPHQQPGSPAAAQRAARRPLSSRPGSWVLALILSSSSKRAPTLAGCCCCPNLYRTGTGRLATTTAGGSRRQCQHRLPRARSPTRRSAMPHLHALLAAHSLLVGPAAAAVPRLSSATRPAAVFAGSSGGSCEATWTAKMHPPERRGHSNELKPTGAGSARLHHNFPGALPRVEPRNSIRDRVQSERTRRVHRHLRQSALLSRHEGGGTAA